MFPNTSKIIRILRKIVTVPIYKYINKRILKQQSKNGKVKHNKQAKNRNVQTSDRQY